MHLSIHDVLNTVSLYYPKASKSIRHHHPQQWLLIFGETDTFIPYPDVRSGILQHFDQIVNKVLHDLADKVGRGQTVEEMDVLDVFVRKSLKKIFSKEKKKPIEYDIYLDLDKLMRSWEKRIVEKKNQTTQPKLSITQIQVIYILKVLIMDNQGPPSRPLLEPQHFNREFQNMHDQFRKDYQQEYKKMWPAPVWEGPQAIAYDISELSRFYSDQQEEMIRVLELSRDREPPDKISQPLQKEMSQSVPQAILGQAHNKQEDCYGEALYEDQSRPILQTQNHSKKDFHHRIEHQISSIQYFHILSQNNPNTCWAGPMQSDRQV